MDHVSNPEAAAPPDPRFAVAFTTHPRVASAPGWAAPMRFGFRACLVYFGLTALFELLQYVPGLAVTFRWWKMLEEALGGWIVVHLLRLPQHGPNDYGEPLRPFLFVIALMVLAIIAAVIWSLVDRRQVAYRRSYAWLHLLVRFALAAVLFDYGWAKIFPGQFGDGVRIWVLPQAVGDQPPGGLLWTFMAASRLYTVFGGLVEVSGAILLCFRATATLGGLISAGALANVVALNFGYDVNVKVYSSVLLLMAIFVTAKDARPLMDFLLRRRPAQPTPTVPLFVSARANRLATVAGLVGAVFLAGQSFGRMWALHSRYHFRADAPKPALVGLFTVDEFARTDAAGGPIAVDSLRWVRIAFPADRATAWVRTAAARDDVYLVQFDASAGTASLHSPGGARPKILFRFEQAQDGSVGLAGTAGGDSISARLRPVDLAKYRLMNNRLRWQW
jgi:hypothetical protein